MLTPQREALDRALAAITRQVLDLEAYARRVLEADAALRAQELMDGNDRYRDLLAQTGDVQGLTVLTEQVDALENALAGSLRDAIEAGRTLAVPRE
ncbi:hypothetical protein Misp01_21220 [Microtetraspora sp. NBRC 13810]|uniref:hypothetical protein n=1 Tax=Microtetraspora sp. NBRC 13810 TaxID=3030990 RepID=UPI0024A0D671|nr:hypothetical protein [Microtetraspora sp. NBRC 13810]GLW06992.1 hypothetical protein Misp01_21220 [Microtetraspora sp. NBRC 13810]